MIARRVRGAAWMMGVAAGLAMLLASGQSQAQVNVGIDGGMVARTSTPGLKPGLAWGLHAGVKPISVLMISGYYLGYSMGMDGLPATAHNVSFDSFGGNLRFTLPLPESNFRPYAYAGLGYVRTSYPVETVVLNYAATSGVPFGLQPREGHFLELPVGLGLGYKAAKIVLLSLDLALRPSFGFEGDAYKGASPVDETKLGFTGLLGASFDL